MTSREETYQPACHGREHVFASAAGVLLGFAQGDGVGTGPVWGGIGSGSMVGSDRRWAFFPGDADERDAES